MRFPMSAFRAHTITDRTARKRTAHSAPSATAATTTTAAPHRTLPRGARPIFSRHNTPP